MSKLDHIRKKILDPETLKSQLAIWRFKEKKIVFTNGCFDIVHYGHIDYLSRAADLGDILLLGLNSDASVKRLKGECRPVNKEFDRSMLLASFSFITSVIIFDDDTPYDLIKMIQPDILIKGGDYKAQDVVGYDLVTARDGKVIILPFIKGYSTTNLIEKISGSNV